MTDGGSMGNYFDRFMEERERRFLSILEEREKTQQVHLDASRREVDRTAVALHEKLVEMNQFRQQLDRERALYVRKDDLGPLEEKIQKIANSAVTHDGLNPRLRAIDDKLNTLSDWKAKADGGFEQQTALAERRFRWLGVALGLVTFMITLIVNVLFRFWPAR